MKAYKTVIYSFFIGGLFALIAQALVTVWTQVLTGTPMQFFIGGSTLILSLIHIYKADIDSYMGLMLKGDVQ